MSFLSGLFGGSTSSDGTKKAHKPRTVNFITLWDEIATAYVYRNRSQYGEVRTKNMYVDMMGIYSDEDNVSFLYSIDGYPKELELSYRSVIRRECKDGVRVSFISMLDKHKIEWNSPQMKAKLRTWKYLDESIADVDEYNLYNNLATIDSQDWRKESLVYLSDAEIRRKRKMFKFRSLMIVSGVRGKNFDDTVKEIINICKTMNIKISRVIGDIPEYLETFSPFSNLYNRKVLDLCGCVTLPDELLARFNTYAQGTIGKKGIYWGTDIYSQFPCLKPVKSTTESAENWLITAETGGGKSYFVKGVIYQLLADSNYNGTIMDIEGFEYLPIADYLSNNDISIVINMGEGTGAYFDPVEIILTGDNALDEDMKALSTSFTLSMFKTLLGGTGDFEWVDIVINDAIAITYTQAGVLDEDMSTWYNSKGLTLFDVYATLKSLLVVNKGGEGVGNRSVSNMFSESLYDAKAGIEYQHSKNDVNRLVTSNTEYQKAIEFCIAKVSRYFEEDGIRASVFSKRIYLEEIRDAKLVICSFGMAGKSPSTVDKIQMALMQLYAANISHLRSIFSKHAGKFNFKLWEEFQRWGGFPGSETTLSTALTGGRKLGDINIIITNDIGKILDNDRFSIFTNITTFAIGCIVDAQVRTELCDRLTIPHMLYDLNMIAQNNKDLTSYIEGDTLLLNPYQKSFLIGLDRTVFTVSRMSIPPSLSKTTLFRTGITLATKGEENTDNLLDVSEEGDDLF